MLQLSEYSEEQTNRQTSRYTILLMHVFRSKYRKEPINEMFDWHGDEIPQIRVCALSASI